MTHFKQILCRTIFVIAVLFLQQICYNSSAITKDLEVKRMRNESLTIIYKESLAISVQKTTNSR